MSSPIRAPWVEKRTGPIVTQMHYARQGIITEEMEYIAKRESLPAETVREEVARRPHDHSRQHPPRGA